VQKFVILLVLILSIDVFGAEKNYNYWVSAGVGPATKLTTRNADTDVKTEKPVSLHPAALSLSATTIYKNISLTGKYIFISDETGRCGRINDLSCENDIAVTTAYQSDISLLIGIGHFTDFGAVNFGAGVSYIKRSGFSKGIDPIDKELTIGVPLELQAIIKANSYLAFGTYLFYSINKLNNLGGVIFAVSIGDFR